jgi:hypothetical protein
LYFEIYSLRGVVPPKCGTNSARFPACLV